MIKKEAYVLGLLFLSGCANIYRTPLLNILVLGNNIPVHVLEIVGLQGQLEYDGGKDVTFICTIFLERIIKIDPSKSTTDVVMFDGASNVQLGGEILKSCYPNITVMREIEHAVYLFFNDISKIPVVNQIISAH